MFATTAQLQRLDKLWLMGAGAGPAHASTPTPRRLSNGRRAG